MSVADTLSVEELYLAIEKRNAAELAETKEQLDAARKTVKELETKVREIKKRPGMSRKSAAPVSQGEESGVILDALGGRELTSANEISELVDLDPKEVAAVLQALVVEGKVVAEGKGRGKRYQLAA